VKIDFGQKLVLLSGETLRLSNPAYGLDSRTVAVIVGDVLNKSELPTDAIIRVSKKIEEVLGKELTLSEAVVTALVSVYAGEEALSGSERIKRMDLARRCNKLGMVKIADSDIKFIMPLVEKKYPGALVSPQIETLLQGKSFSLVTEDEPDDPAPPPVEK